MNLESSVELLERVKDGDTAALERLLAKYVGPLRGWAHRRLPTWARDLSETQDLVQDALIKALRNLGQFKPDGPGALHKYLRLAVSNRIRDEIRRVSRRPVPVDLLDNLADGSESPMDQAIGKQAIEAYRTALAQLREDDRELVIARLEHGFSYAELAAMFDKPTAAAARTAARRAVLKLASLMQGSDVVRTAR
jgi:RNA polymerase sigma-70 factor, ECF subfamily